MYRRTDQTVIKRTEMITAMKYLDEPVEHLARDDGRGGEGTVGRAGVVRGGHERGRGRRGELRDLRCQDHGHGR